MRAAGLRVHPNTDDPTFHNVTPTLAWQMMARDFGYSIDDLRACMLNGIDAAWIDEGPRQRLRREWSAEFDQLRRTVQ
jgi:adenosine deaminase